MTLDETRRYDSDRVQNQGERAVVVGASMAGLLAGRVLADAFDEVVVVERDQLPQEPTVRRGVPQGRHVHVLLEAGRATVSDLFPGYCEDLIDAGAIIINVGEDLRHYDEGGFVALPATRMEMYCASRPLIETVVRKHLSSIDGVTIRSGCQFTDYLLDASESAIEGVHIREDGDEEDISADLVVDATGRTSRTPTWLSEHGYQSPPVDEVTVNFEYSTIRLARPPENREMIFAPQSAPRTYGGAAFPIENGEWLITFGGMHDSSPPTEVDAFHEFAGRLPVDGIERLLAEHEVVSDGVDRYPFASNLRRRYEELDRFPDGLVVLGDAIASFNPIYGQGMSVAALEAIQLHHTLATPGTGAIGPRFFDRAQDLIDIAWSMAVGADMAFEQTTGPAPRGTKLFTRYFSQFVQEAHTDQALAETFYRILGMETSPSTLLHPRVMWRIVRS